MLSSVADSPIHCHLLVTELCMCGQYTRHVPRTLCKNYFSWLQPEVVQRRRTSPCHWVASTEGYSSVETLTVDEECKARNGAFSVPEVSQCEDA